MTASRQEQARRLGALRRRLWLIGLALGLLVPVAWLWSGAAAVLWAALSSALPPLVAVPLLLGLFYLSQLLVHAPLSYLSGFVLGHRFGLSRQRFRDWLADWLKAALLGLGFGTLVSSGYYAALALLGANWWWGYGLALVVGLALLSYVLPYVIVPLFYRMRPVEDQAVAAAIERLVTRANTRVAGVCELDFSRKTSEGNAAVIGLGRSRRVVIADTLLHEYPLPEIEAIVAHELGHHVQRDVLKLLAVQGAFLLAGLWLATTFGPPALDALGLGRLDSVDNFPALALAAELYSLALLPLGNALSRRIEAAADRYALTLTGSPAAFAAALRRLADQNLIEERPPRWAVLLLASHPPIADRIALTKEHLVA
jgi:STE24 endopeptidase